MEKQIKYQNVIFKFDGKDKDRSNNITYNFKIYDKITKSKTIELLAKSKNIMSKSGMNGMNMI